MVHSCCVTTCKIESYPGCGMSFHRLPTDKAMNEQWKQAIPGNLKFSKSSVVCDLHFKDDDYVPFTRKKLKPDAIPSIFPAAKKNYQSLYQKYVAELELNAATSGSKRICYGTEEPTSDTEIILTEDFLGAQNTDTTKQIFIYSDNDQESLSNESHVTKENPIHLDFSCNVCLKDIVGFRYVCVQCVDWDMCASCEARGEHPEHYVLRLPAPKPKAECDAVLAAIRKDIDDLLKLNNKMQDYCLKEELAEVKEEIDLDLDETSLSPESDDRSVPEVIPHRENSMEVGTHRKSSMEVIPPRKSSMEVIPHRKSSMEVRTLRNSSIRKVPKKTTRHDSSSDNSDDHDEVSEVTGFLPNVETTPDGERFLVIDKTFKRKRRKTKS